MNWKRRRIAILTLLSVCLTMLMVWPIPAKADTVDGRIRVLLTRLQLTDRIDISLDGSYTYENIAFQRGSRITISCASGTLMLYHEALALDAGNRIELIRHDTDPKLENGLRVNDAYPLYPGDLILTVKNGQLQCVLRVPVEEYLLGVLPYEMSEGFPLEALKAQAVAARTYALKKAGKSDEYDVEDNTTDQVFAGLSDPAPIICEAVEKTTGICAYYHGKLITAYYTASNGGIIESAKNVWGTADSGYSIQKSDPYDLENYESVVKSVTFPKQITLEERSALTPELQKLSDFLITAVADDLTRLGYSDDQENLYLTELSSIETQNNIKTGKPQILIRFHLAGKRLLGADGEEEVYFEDSGLSDASSPQTTGSDEQLSGFQTIGKTFEVIIPVFPDFETAFGLSINGANNEVYTVSEDEDSFTIEARRFGHGVGLSQRGAQLMAEKYGWSYQRILHFYYHDVTLTRATYSFRLPEAVSSAFLATPGPAATPTPRPTLMPITADTTDVIAIVTGIGKNSSLNLRERPDTVSDVLIRLYYGQRLIVTEELGDWLKVRTDVIEGYVMKQFIEIESESKGETTP
ncbi:MAG: SpoIID/LytB domain-containing protein [Clostridia bacterium]|nr:SpoIID/LytB domain-containing protein [Clostridia bacterium]